VCGRGVVGGGGVGIGLWACMPFPAVATLPLQVNFARSEKREEVS
jgi:hypothetical protein